MNRSQRLYPEPTEEEAYLDFLPDGDENDSQNMFRIHVPAMGLTGTSRDIRRFISEWEQTMVEISDALRRASGD